MMRTQKTPYETQNKPVPIADALAAIKTDGVPSATAIGHAAAAFSARELIGP
jgi:hypothetical protein